MPSASTSRVWTPGGGYGIRQANRDGRAQTVPAVGAASLSISLQLLFNSFSRVVRWEMPIPPEPSLPVPMWLDLVNERLWCGDQARVLRPKTFALLRYLVEHPGQLLTKAALLEALWPETMVSEVVLSVCIRELRQVLGDDAKTPRFIETVHRRGLPLYWPPSHGAARPPPACPPPRLAAARRARAGIGRAAPRCWPRR